LKAIAKIMTEQKMKLLTSSVNCGTLLNVIMDIICEKKSCLKKTHLNTCSLTRKKVFLNHLFTGTWIAFQLPIV